MTSRHHKISGKWRSRVISAVLILACPFARAADLPTIEWYLIDLPPIQIASGTLAGMGYTDKFRWRLIAGLPEYRHVVRIANVQRILADIRTKPNICNPAFLKTPEREQFMVYAEPTHAQFPNGAVVHKSRRAELREFISEAGTLAVDKLIDGGGTVAVQSGRSYGAKLDRMIDKARSESRLVMLTSSRPVEAKLGLLKRNRADATFLYPYELAYFLRNTGETEDYEFLPVDGNGTYTLNYLACSSSALGRQIVAASNRIIAAERGGYFAAAYREWLPTAILDLHAMHHRHAFSVSLVPAGASPGRADEEIAACLLAGKVWQRQKCETDVTPAH